MRPSTMSCSRGAMLIGNKKSAKQFLPDFDKLIPSDAPNHDDSNDFFNDLVKLEDLLMHCVSAALIFLDLARAHLHRRPQSRNGLV